MTISDLLCLVYVIIFELLYHCVTGFALHGIGFSLLVSRISKKVKENPDS